MWCQKGCDIGRGRMSDDLKRVEATKMCQMLAQSNYQVANYENLEHLEDLRIHATLYPTNAGNLYRACLAGIRRQRYWFIETLKDLEIITIISYLKLDWENK